MALVSKAAKSKFVAPTIKGGQNVYDRISSITALVKTKLGKYAEQYQLLQTESEIENYFEAIIKNGYGAIDTETDSLDPITCTLAGICIYTEGKKSAYIPLNHISYITGAKSKDQASASWIKLWLSRCEQEHVEWVAHNAKFDVRVLRNQLGVDVSILWDTLLAAKCLNENESASLKDLHLKYCDSQDAESLTYSNLFEGIPFTLIPFSVGYLYAAGDPLKTWELYQFQKQYLNDKVLPGCHNVFRNIEMPLIPVLAEMEDHGIAFDVEYANYLHEKYGEQLADRETEFYNSLKMYEKEIQAYKGRVPNHKLSDPITIGSPTQIAILLYDIMGIEPPDPRTPRGTGEDILAKIKSPVASSILDYRETSKLMTTYIDKLPTSLNAKTGRIHGSFNAAGTQTGRFSSSDPNLQNIPSKNKEIRKMFRASDGHVMISCDFSQQEPRILAHMSQDGELIQAYRDGKDIYAWIAEKIYRVPYDECREFRKDGTKNPEGKKRRDSVKSIILGIMYGRGAKAIAEQLSISVKEAQKIVDQFYSTFPKVREWMNQVLEDARETGYVETAWGRKRRLPDVQLPIYEFSAISGKATNFDPLDFGSSQSFEVDAKTQKAYTQKLDKAWGSQRRTIIAEAYEAGIKIKDNGGFIADAERQAVNSIIQGSAADMTKIAMTSIGTDPELKRMGCHLIIQVHDEIIVECLEEYAKECANRVSKLMIDSAKGKITVPMKCDAEITRCWYGEEYEDE